MLSMKKTFPMGHKERKIHLATVSGVATTKPELIRWFGTNVPEVEVITTKSFQVRPNSGNREPVICETESGNLGNSVGLRNPGMDVSLPPLQALKEEGLDRWLNVSLSADNPQDFITLIKAFDSVADSVELNFSCPHAKKGFGASIGSDIAVASEYVEKIHEATKDRSSLLFIKLTPNVENIGEIARSVIEKGADGISAINTVGPALHVDPVSSTPILQNALGGKGGKSGKWVFSRALECISEIRQYVGDNIPIIGMGGVWSGRDAAAMVEAGADVVGVGSVLSHVRQYSWPLFFSSLCSDAENCLKGISSDTSSAYLEKERQMAYSLYKVCEKKFHSDDTIILTLDGEMANFKAGEFVFLWVPGVGEKPFSVASSSPLSFIVKKRGVFTSHLFESVNEGDDIFIRGPYGKGVDAPEAEKALIVAGGTGEAVALPLAKTLKEKNTEISFLVGTSVSGNRGILEKELSFYGRYLCVSDEGKPGRILDSLPQEAERIGKDGAYYLIGPEIFMKNAAKTLKLLGIPGDRILLSMEKNTMCGVGLCGECSCGGRLSCQWGTFMTLSFLEKEGVL